jgi:hypothetical protein
MIKGEHVATFPIIEVNGESANPDAQDYGDDWDHQCDCFSWIHNFFVLFRFIPASAILPAPSDLSDYESLQIVSRNTRKVFETRRAAAQYQVQGGLDARHRKSLTGSGING